MFAIRFLQFPLVALALAVTGNVWAADAQAPAIALESAQHAPLVAVSQVGRRLVAVGDHGIVVLSDDGETWRQASSVPVTASSATSTAARVENRLNATAAASTAAAHQGLISGATYSANGLHSAQPAGPRTRTPRSVSLRSRADRMLRAIPVRDRKSVV